MIQFRYIALAAAVGLAVLLSVTFRTTVIPAPYGYIEKDHWTGSTTACAVDSPDDTNGRLLREQSKRALLADAGFKPTEIDGYFTSHPVGSIACTKH